MNRQYKEDNQYKYFVSIFNDSYELWMWEEDLNYSERKFFTI